MKFDIKKNLIDPLTSKKISIPSPERISLLRNNDTYDTFNDVIEKQRNATVGGIWKIIVTAVVGFGIAVYEYIVMRAKNEECYDEAELLINEAIADEDEDINTEKENEI